jgi:hypothetical protein
VAILMANKKPCQAGATHEMPLGHFLPDAPFQEIVPLPGTLSAQIDRPETTRSTLQYQEYTEQNEQPLRLVQSCFSAKWYNATKTALLMHGIL